MVKSTHKHVGPTQKTRFNALEALGCVNKALKCGGEYMELLSDGTLIVTMEDVAKVNRVIVEDGSHFCKVFYEDCEGCSGHWKQNQALPKATLTQKLQVDSR